MRRSRLLSRDQHQWATCQHLYIAWRQLVPRVVRVTLHEGKQYNGRIAYRLSSPPSDILLPPMPFSASLGPLHALAHLIACSSLT